MSFRYAATPAERMNINPTKMHSLELLLLALDLRSTNRELIEVFPFEQERLNDIQNRCVKTTFFLVSEETHSSEEGGSH